MSNFNNLNSLTVKGPAEFLGEVKFADKVLESSIEDLNYSKGLTGNIQEQLNYLRDNKSEIGHDHKATEVSGLSAVATSGSYGDLIDRPKIPSIEGLATEAYVNTQIDKIEIPKYLSDFTDDVSHRLVTDIEKTNWNLAKVHADSAHAPVEAEKNQNAFSNIKVGNMTVSADTTTDTLTLEGSNVTITPDTTNDKITFTVADGNTSTKGIVKLTNSTSSTSTTTAATPSSVKAAYDLANQAKIIAEDKADSDHTHSLSNFGITATASELNHLDGIESTATELNYLHSQEIEEDGLDLLVRTHDYIIDNKYAVSLNTKFGFIAGKEYTLEITTVSGESMTITSVAEAGTEDFSSAILVNFDGVEFFDNTHPNADGDFELGGSTWYYYPETAISKYVLIGEGVNGMFTHTTTGYKAFGEEFFPKAVQDIKPLKVQKPGFIIPYVSEGVDHGTSTYVAFSEKLNLKLGESYTLSVTDEEGESRVLSGVYKEWELEQPDDSAISVPCIVYAEQIPIIMNGYYIDENDNIISFDGYSVFITLVPEKTGKSILIGIKEDNTPLTHEEEEIMVMPVNISGEAATLTGLTTTVEELNFPIGRATEGENSEIFNDYESNNATGTYCHVEGVNNNDSGSTTNHIEGSNNINAGSYNHIEGASNEITASGAQYNHIEGYNNTLSYGSSYNHIEGESHQITGGSTLHVEGDYHQVSSGSGHIEGWQHYVDSGAWIHVEGGLNSVHASYCHVEGQDCSAGVYDNFVSATYKTSKGDHAHAEGYRTFARAPYSHTEGYGTTTGIVNTLDNGLKELVGGEAAHAQGYYTTAYNLASHASGKFNKNMTTGCDYYTQVGDVFVIGNGTNSVATSNAFRVTYTGETYGLKAFNSSGADYAEFVYPWYDDNIDGEDRIGYFVTFKDGKLHKATSKDIIIGVTSGNPSVVGNADEDYYWRYERDEFNRIVFEDVEEEVQKVDEEGNPIFDENGKPVLEKTGNIIKNGRMKLSEKYDPALQDSYIERKNRQEWDYVGMLGVIPVRDDGTCLPGQYCKCNDDGIATSATTEDMVTNRFTYTVLERVSNNVIKILMTIK